MAKRDEKKAVELACKKLGVSPKDLLDWAVREKTGQVVVIIPTGQKYVFDIEQLEAEEPAAALPPARAKVDTPPPTTTQLKGPAPETTRGGGAKPGN